MAASAGYGEMMVEVQPWFRAHWALDGVAVDDATGALLHHDRFVDAACCLFGADEVRPSTLLVNLMGPMPSGGAMRHRVGAIGDADAFAAPVWLARRREEAAQLALLDDRAD